MTGELHACKNISDLVTYKKVLVYKITCQIKVSRTSLSVFLQKMHKFSKQLTVDMYHSLMIFPQTNGREGGFALAHETAWILAGRVY